MQSCTRHLQRAGLSSSAIHWHASRSQHWWRKIAECDDHDCHTSPKVRVGYSTVRLCVARVEAETRQSLLTMTISRWLLWSSRMATSRAWCTVRLLRSNGRWEPINVYELSRLRSSTNVDRHRTPSTINTTPLQVSLPQLLLLLNYLQLFNSRCKYHELSYRDLHCAACNTLKIEDVTCHRIESGI